MIPFAPPRIDQVIIDEVTAVLKSGWITTGPKTKLFENKLTEYCGNKSTICLNSATAGLEVILRWFGVGAGDEVIIPAYTYAATANVVVHCGAKPVLVDVKSELRNGVTIISVAHTGKNRFSRMTIAARNVYRAAKKLNAAVYHFHDPELIPFALRLQKQGKKVIYDVHEDIPRQIMAKYYIPELFKKLISYGTEKLENRAAASFSWIVTATPFIRRRFRKFNEHTTDICNFPLQEEFTASAPYLNRPMQLCYIGSLTRARGILELIKAMETLPYNLHLCGTFAPPELRDEAMKLPGWNRVTEHGHSSRQVVHSVLESSRIGMVTLHPIINYVDAYPVKLFEYMMAGIPVIASDIPLWKQIVEEAGAGICVNPMDPEAIKNGIVTLMNNEALSKTMGEAGQRQVVSKYNWSQEEAKLLNIYHTLSNV